MMLLATALVLGGCGQKGDLYQAPAESRAGAAAAADAGENRKPDSESPAQ